MNVNNSRRLGLALFALATIIFFGQRYVLTFVSMIASLFVPPESGFYTIMLQSYNAMYALYLILIIAGVVLFYKGRKKTNLSSAAPGDR